MATVEHIMVDSEKKDVMFLQHNSENGTEKTKEDMNRISLLGKFGENDSTNSFCSYKNKFAHS